MIHPFDPQEDVSVDSPTSNVGVKIGVMVGLFILAFFLPFLMTDHVEKKSPSEKQELSALTLAKKSVLSETQIADKKKSVASKVSAEKTPVETFPLEKSDDSPAVVIDSVVEKSQTDRSSLVADSEVSADSVKASNGEESMNLPTKSGDTSSVSGPGITDSAGTGVVLSLPDLSAFHLPFWHAWHTGRLSSADSPEMTVHLDFISSEYGLSGVDIAGEMKDFYSRLSPVDRAEVLVIRSGQIEFYAVQEVSDGTGILSIRFKDSRGNKIRTAVLSYANQTLTWVADKGAEARANAVGYRYPVLTDLDAVYFSGTPLYVDPLRINPALAAKIPEGILTHEGDKMVYKMAPWEAMAQRLGILEVSLLGNVAPPSDASEIYFPCRGKGFEGVDQAVKRVVMLEKKMDSLSDEYTKLKQSMVSFARMDESKKNAIHAELQKVSDELERINESLSKIKRTFKSQGNMGS